MKKLKKFCIGVISLTVLFASTTVFAKEDFSLTPLLTEDFIEWEALSEKDKKDTLIPRVSTVDIQENTVLNGNQDFTNLRNKILLGDFVKNSKSALLSANNYNLSRYDLNDSINVNVKHQGITSECWAFSMTSVLETNIALTQNLAKKFSARHMDYSTIRTFSDGINKDNFSREAGNGGLAQCAVAYLSNGRGAVLESQMPFENNTNVISISELNKPVDTIVTDTVTFPSVYKEYDANGNITYTNGGRGTYKKNYTLAEISAFRLELKKHIVQYGAISAVTAGNASQYYSNPEKVSEAGAYFCNNNSISRDHAITIVGWDDNYSRDNFTGSAKPKSNGAYICLNSYGVENFDNGYIYVSYEDCLIETSLYGIKSANGVDYNKIYQYNPTGSTTSLGVDLSSEPIENQKGYIAQIFDRDASKVETLKYIGIDLPEKMALKIYVNSNGTNPAISYCKPVATTEVLSAGYHRIPIKATKLDGNSFTVVVEEIPTNSRFEFSIEIAVSNSIFSTILGNPGKCLYSLNGTAWGALSSAQVSGFDMTTADTTIKAFTVDGDATIPDVPDEPEEPTDPENPDVPTEPDAPTEPDNPEEPTKISISSEKYKIVGTDINKIVYNTTIRDFKKNITTNSSTVEFYNSANKKITNETEIVKTGYKIKLSDGTTYTLIVRGDVNCDGTISLVDLSKIVAHYGDQNKYGLTGNVLKAADMNLDGKITLVDISQILEIIGHLQ